MKLRNKRTGEIVHVDFVYPDTAEYFYPGYKLEAIIEEWEDYEPKDGLTLEENTMENEDKLRVNETRMCLLDGEEIKALISFHYENIRAAIEEMNDVFNCVEFNDKELIRIMRYISNEICLVKFYEELKHENKS